MLSAKRVLSASAMIMLIVAVAMLALSGMAAAESEEVGPELQNYFSNANTTGGQAFINLIDPLEANSTEIIYNSISILNDATGTDPIDDGSLSVDTCAMIYIFNTEQSMQACCGCPLTPDQLLTFSITSQLAGNPVALGTLLHDGDIRVLSSYPNAVDGYPVGNAVYCDPGTGFCCDPTASLTGFTLTLGSELVGWADHIQNTGITETVFQADDPTAAELNDGLPEACASIIHLGSNQGVCTCPFGEVSTPGPPPFAPGRARRR